MISFGKYDNSVIVFLLMFIMLFHTNILAFNIKEASNQIPSQLFQRKKLSIDLDKFVSYAQIQNMLQQSHNYIFVDIRHQSDYNKIRIPKSINVQYYALKTKQFLKDKTIILTNDGFGLKRLVSLAGQLESSGFHSVKILKNGLNGWYKSGGRLEGNVFEYKKLNRLSPDRFFLDKDYQNIIVIELLKDKQLPTPLINNSFHISITVNFEKTLAEINKLLSKHFQNSIYCVIICDDTRFVDYMEKNITSPYSQSIFYLDEGIQAYKQFLHNQAIIIDRDSRKKTKEPFCKKCGE
jgi:rhodanese-related sulfurtransferase